MRRQLIIGLALAILTLAVFWRAGGGAFLNYDDHEYVTENFQVRQGLTWGGMGWAFTSFHAGNWHPLAWLSHMADVRLFGLEPRGHHLTSVVLHAANACLLFLILRAYTMALWPSALAAALFALHPLHVESVAWVSERKDVLSALFWFLTMGAYLWYLRRPRPRRYLAVLILFTLGLMSKPVLVTLPFALLLLDGWPLGRFGRGGSRASAGLLSRRSLWLVLEKFPLLGLSAVSAVVTYLAQVKGEAVSTALEVPFRARAANALWAYLLYLWRTVWPSGLAVFYPHPGETLPWWRPAVSALILLGVSIMAARAARRLPWAAMGWLWYLGTLMPMIGLVQVGDQAMADRYTYIPLLGVFIAAAWTFPRGAGSRRPWAAVWIAVLGLLAAVTWRQIGYWTDSKSVFEHALEVTEGNYVAHVQLGNVLVREGNSREALVHYTEAVSIRSRIPEAYNNIGNILMRQGNYAEAKQYYAKALIMKSNFAQAQFNLGLILEKEGKPEAALYHYSQALEVKPDFAEALNGTGMVLVQLGRFEEAAAYFRRALVFQPGVAEIHFNLGQALSRQGKPPEAQEEYRRALLLRPAYASAHNNLGLLLLQEGKAQEALGHFSRALEINPSYAGAHLNMAVACERLGKPVEAETHYREALRLQPDFRDAGAGLRKLLGGGD